MMNDLCNSQQFTTVGDPETTAGSTFPIFALLHCEILWVLHHPQRWTDRNFTCKRGCSTVSMPGLEANFPLRWYWDHQNAPPTRCSSHTSTSSWYGMWYQNLSHQKGTQMFGYDVSVAAVVVVVLLLLLFVLVAASVVFVLCELANVQRGIPKSLNWDWSLYSEYAAFFLSMSTSSVWIAHIWMDNQAVYIYSTTQDLPEQVSFHLGHSLAVSFVDAILLVCFEIFITWTSKKAVG